METSPKQVLYISYDGMTDPLGQSQVLPYLIGLSKKGYHFHLISFEKQHAYLENKDKINKILQENGISWYPLNYTKNPPVLSTIYDIRRMIAVGSELINRFQIRMVHCRSYISALAGLQFKKKSGVRIIFDMRGFYADERVDGGLWKLSNPVYSMIYRYFKHKEKELIRTADAVISLTETGKNIIDSWNIRPASLLPVTVIPCCADLDHFDRSKITDQSRELLMKSLNIKSGQTVLSYLGALGTWYMPKEMLRFFVKFSERYPDALFLFITHDTEESILNMAKQEGVAPEKIRVYKASRENVPIALSLSTASLFFIKPVFSKKASSPTKQGEIMGMGIPVICNSGVGDTDLVVQKYRSGMLLNVEDPASFADVIDKFEQLKQFPPDQIRQGANDFFSLEKGVLRYAGVYDKLI
jgi:glycosyltransferase involved in cell wall biosynthesis